jgi:ATP-dependent Lhr-like helicase
MEDTNSPLSIFHPMVQRWFSRTYGEPTDAQAQAWKEIASGKHVLISAPTGSGKTLAAFLWALNSLISGKFSAGATRIVYVSPLKALNVDIKENLLIPLREIKKLFLDEGQKFHDITVVTRSGDTPAGDRQKMLRRPPEILVTTPESLNLLLSSPRARFLLSHISTFIIDEVHAVVSQKRGSHLTSAIERTALLSGEFQRIALSATVKPLERVAGFVGGYRLKYRDGHAVYEQRKLAIIKSEEHKQFEVKVHFPQKEQSGEKLWPLLAREFLRVIHRNRSTLVFTNTRRLAERIARIINETEGQDIAYSHHGSLSKEIRGAVERELRAGNLSAIVATSSLELGIDIGVLDEIILVQTPPSIMSAIQRIGRSGHAVGQKSTGIVYPTHSADLLEAAVMARCVVEKDIEEARPVKGPLDVLAQVIVSMTGIEEWNIDRLFEFIRSCESFHTLSRRYFDLVIDMLEGRYADTRVRELQPRVSVNRRQKSIRGRGGVLSLVYHSGGTIPDRGYYGLVLEGMKAKIGELDEEFVWERKVGETFHFGSGTWKITGIDQRNVEVVHWNRNVQYAPFWKGEKEYRGFHFSRRIGEFLEWAEQNINRTDFLDTLISDSLMDVNAAEALIRFLGEQREKTGAELPHRHHVLVEKCAGPGDKVEVQQVVIHVFWGARVTKPFSMALSAAWEMEFGYSIEVYSDESAVIILLPLEVDAARLLDMVRAENVEELLRVRLEQSGFFGARFRENAARALLLPRKGFKERMPLWLNRLRSKKLFDAVMHYEDFPVILETWRECLQDAFEIEDLKRMLDELHSGAIRVTEVHTKSPSPFIRNTLWRQTNAYMYKDDTPTSHAVSRIDEALFKDLLHSSNLRPKLDRDLIDEYQKKLQRTYPGYSPRTAPGLYDLVKERVLIAEDEWNALLSAMKRDTNRKYAELVRSVSDKLRKIMLPGARYPSIAALEVLPGIVKAFARDPEQITIKSVTVPRQKPDEPQQHYKKDEANTSAGIDEMISPELATAYDGERTAVDFEILREWLFSYGPVKLSAIKDVFGVDESKAQDMVHSLSEQKAVVLGKLTVGADEIEVCDAQNMEFLLRRKRSRARSDTKTIDCRFLPFFVAHCSGLTRRGHGVGDLKNVLETLFGYPAQAELWEKEFFPARIERFNRAWLDTLLGSSDLIWFGCGKKNVSFCFSQDIELFLELEKHTQNEITLFPGSGGRYAFPELLQFSGLKTKELGTILWELVWEGRVLNDSWNTVRTGIGTNFAACDSSETPRGLSKKRFGRWNLSPPMSGTWYTVRHENHLSDPLSELEMQKNRVRQVLERYGVIFREILEYECSALRWSRILRALRVMELSGEIVGGHFFEGIQGLQFLSQKGFRIFTRGFSEDVIYWMNACDPASLCGLKVEPLKGLPPRVPSTHLVYHGSSLVIISRREGKELEISVAPDDPNLISYYRFFKDLISRDVDPLSSVKVETVNGIPVFSSNYLSSLKSFGFRSGYRRLTLEKSTGDYVSL